MFWYIKSGGGGMESAMQSVERDDENRRSQRIENPLVMQRSSGFFFRWEMSDDDDLTSLRADTLNSLSLSSFWESF